MIPTKFYKQILKHYKNVENFIKISTSNSKHVTKHKTSYYKTYQKQQPQNNKLLIKPISETKVKETIFQMENQKSPGIDGIPI